MISKFFLYASIVVWEHILYDFSYFEFFESCFMAYYMVYPGECSMCTWDVYSAIAVWIFYRCQSGLAGWYSLANFLSDCAIHYWDGVLKSLPFSSEFYISAFSDLLFNLNTNLRVIFYKSKSDVTPLQNSLMPSHLPHSEFKPKYIQRLEVPHYLSPRSMPSPLLFGPAHCQHPTPSISQPPT